MITLIKGGELMRITLINCKDRLISKGILVDSDGWQEQLYTALTSYLVFDGWSYDYVTDTLIITSPEETIIPDNISDFGEVVGDGTFIR